MTELDVLTMFNDIARKVEKGKQFNVVSREDKITALGIDSVSMMEIIGVMEDELNIKIPDDKLARLQTVGDIERVIHEVRGNA